MTPKEKAQELLSRWRNYDTSYAVMLALWCVDEIIKAEPSKLVKCRKYAHRVPTCDYWKEVKEELNKL